MGAKPVDGLHEQGRRPSMESELVFDFQPLNNFAHAAIYFSTSRCLTWMGNLLLFNLFRSSSTSTTERCLPPVHPKARVKLLLPSRSYRGNVNSKSANRRSRNAR